MKRVITQMNLPKGRPRDQHADTKILEAALRLLERHGFRAVTLEGIAEEAGVARTTVYRRWPNKAAVVMDAFLTQVAPGIAFPEHPVAVERLRLQMQLLARAFRQGPGLLIRSLIAEAQFDEELRAAVHHGWIAKRRASAKAIIADAILAGELPNDVNADALLDTLYGGLYYWLLIDHEVLTEAYVDSLFATVLGPSSHMAQSKRFDCDRDVPGATSRIRSG
ncbi:MAG: Transcriptional regulator, TetR family [Bryobacterales bacterium]|nr:Transcriptional regulator, TetR family [Bryobacterales bacterium]